MASWGVSKTSRKDEYFVKRTTMPTVGPGSYDIKVELDRKIYN